MYSQPMRCSSWMALCNYYNSHWNFNGKLLKTNFVKSTRHLLFRKVRITLYGTIILAYVVYGYKSPCLSLRVEYGLMMFKNWVLGGIFRPKSVQVWGAWTKLRKRSFIICTLNQIAKSRLRYAGRVVHMRDGKCLQYFCCIAWREETEGVGRTRALNCAVERERMEACWLDSFGLG
jgi:hypothetical protein